MDSIPERGRLKSEQSNEQQMAAWPSLGSHRNTLLSLSTLPVRAKLSLQASVPQSEE